MTLKFETMYSELATQAYLINEVKKPLLEAVPVIFDPEAGKIAKLKAAVKLWRAMKALNQLPQPGIDNTWHPNAHNLIRLRDWVVSCIPKLAGERRQIVEVFFDLVIILIDMDPPWRYIIDRVNDEALKMKWMSAGWNDDWVESYDWWEEQRLEMAVEKPKEIIRV